MSSTAERKIQCYPSMKYFKFINAYAEINEMSKSEVVALAIKNWVDNLPPSDKMKVENAAKKYSKNSY